MEESGFEEVGLHDEQGDKQQQQQTQTQTQTQRRRGLFARFGDSGGQGPGHDSRDQSPATPTFGNPVSRFLMPGRKRAQSGQGSELGTMERTQAVEADGQEVR